MTRLQSIRGAWRDSAGPHQNSGGSACPSLSTACNLELLSCCKYRVVIINTLRSRDSRMQWLHTNVEQGLKGKIVLKTSSKPRCPGRAPCLSQQLRFQLSRGQLGPPLGSSIDATPNYRLKSLWASGHQGSEARPLVPTGGLSCAFLAKSAEAAPGEAGKLSGSAIPLSPGRVHS